MSRRRRQKNPLLVRIVLITVVVHLIALPILAHYGAFSKVRQSFGTSTIVMNFPNERPKAPPPVAKKPKKAAETAKRAGANRGRAASVRKDLTKVQVANGPSSSGGPTVQQGGKAGGTLPEGVGGHGPVVAPHKTGPPPPPTAPRTEPRPFTKPAPTPENAKAVVNPPPPPHVPVFAEAEPTFQPQPVIPDDLRQDSLDKTCTVDVEVASDGSVEAATVAGSTGIRELDDVALKTIRTWKFRAATEDGSAIAGKARVHIEFKVE